LFCSYKEIGSETDIDFADDLIIQIHVEQGLYEDVINLIEAKITKGNYDLKTNNLLTLAESYLVIGNNIKAFETIKEVEKEVIKRRLSHRYKGKIDSALNAYMQINSDNPLPGYKKLFEEEIVTNEYIKKELLKQLNVTYPNEF
jgi:hypothetical protein